MPFFRKKPVAIEAVRYEGRESQPYIQKLGLYTLITEIDGVPYLKITTLEGDLLATPGDWIIKGVKGEFCPCKPDIFEATYDAVPSPGQHGCE